jgi:CHASE3 domain sensor protein
MDFLTTRGKIVIGGLFVLLLLSTGFASLTATIMIHRNHELQTKYEQLQEKAEALQVKVKQLENGEVK